MSLDEHMKTVDTKTSVLQIKQVNRSIQGINKSIPVLFPIDFRRKHRIHRNLKIIIDHNIYIPRHEEITQNWTAPKIRY